jgi:hypothetical protein
MLKLQQRSVRIPEAVSDLIMLTYFSPLLIFVTQCDLRSTVRIHGLLSAENSRMLSLDVILLTFLMSQLDAGYVGRNK